MQSTRARELISGAPRLIPGAGVRRAAGCPGPAGAVVVGGGGEHSLPCFPATPQVRAPCFGSGAPHERMSGLFPGASLGGIAERGDRQPADRGGSERFGSSEVAVGRAPEDPEGDDDEPARAAAWKREARDELTPPVRARRSRAGDPPIAADDGNPVLHRMFTTNVGRDVLGS